MPYQVDAALWDSVFAVPAKIVDQHLKLCGAASLKVLLLLLRRGGAVDLREVAELLSLPAADVLDALNYWIHLGVVRDTGAPEPASREEKPPVEPEKSAPVPDAPVERRAENEKKPAPRMPGNGRKRLSTRQINEMSSGDESVAYLLQEAQSVLGKPLTPVATDAIASLYGYYGMQPDLILMLLQYCVSIGKDNMRYVEKVAAGWIEAGIDTHEKAEQEILRAAARKKSENRIRKLLGIHDRSLIRSELDFIYSWTEQMACSEELIMLAYERTITRKGKLSFAYINGILQNWHQKGISTAAQAMEEMRQSAGKRKDDPRPQAASYDMRELEQLIT